MIRRSSAVLIALFSSGVAHAEEVALVGWSDTGDAVIKVKDPAKSVAYGKGQELFFARCTPVAFDRDKDTPVKCVSCAVATEDPATGCKLVPAKLVSSLTSPDKKLTLKKSASCVTGSETNKDCSVAVELPGLGALHYTNDTFQTKDKKPQVNVWFRADSKAVVIDAWNVVNGAREDGFWVIDVADLHGRAAAPALVRSRVAAQLGVLGDASNYTKDALLFTDEAARTEIAPGQLAEAVKATGAVKASGTIEVAVALDGRSAWATFAATTSTGAWRVSELFIRDGSEWKIASGYWSRGLADATAHEQAMAGKLPKLLARTKDSVPEALSGYVKMLRSTKDDAKDLSLAAARPGVKVIGTAPNERAAGKALDRAWRSWINGGVSFTSTRGASVGGTGWLLVTVDVSKTKGAKQYVLPVRAWMVIDESGDPDLSGVVVAHFSIAQ